MNTDINDASTPISNKMSAMFNVGTGFQCMGYDITWTLAIHFDLHSLVQQYQPDSYCIRHYYDPMLFECWPAVSDIGPSLKQHWVNVSCLLRSAPGINSRPNTATLTKCWASVVDGVPAVKQRLQGKTLNQCLFNVCQTNIHRMWHKCWASFIDDALALNQQKKTI